MQLGSFHYTKRCILPVTSRAARSPLLVSRLDLETVERRARPLQCAEEFAERERESAPERWSVYYVADR